MTTPEGIKGEVQSVNVLRQLVKVIVDIDDEKEIREYKVDELKFRPRHKKDKVKLSKEERAAMGQKARQKMEREFDREKVADAYMEEIETIQNRKEG